VKPTRMKGSWGWAPPHDEEHDEDLDCRGPHVEPGSRCVPVTEDQPAYDPPPTHYEGNGIMPWDVIQAWSLDYWLGNVVKYICRAGKKDIAPRLDDLKKARNFINKAIELEEQRERDS
jgi:hypothetical protein